MTSFVVPSAAAVSDILGMLYGGAVEAQENANPKLEGCFVASFLDDNDQLVTACACDPPFVAYSGACLSMIPAGGAKDMVENNDFSQAILDNFHEVMNICSRLFMSESSPHLRLNKSLSPSEGADIISSLEGATLQSFTLDIPKYGQGTITFLVT